MRLSIYSILIIGIIICCYSQALALDVTYDSLIELKAAGVNDAQMVNIIQGAEKVDLTKAQIKKLGRLGFSDTVLEAARNRISGAPVKSVEEPSHESTEGDVKEEKDVEVGAKGIGVTYKKEELVKAAGPVDKTWLNYWAANAVFISGDFINAIFVGGGVGSRYLNPSGFFPGPEGGKRHAFSFEALGLLNAGSTTIKIDDEETKTSSFNLTTAAIPAYVYMWFKPQDEKAKEVGGKGIKVGLKVALDTRFSSPGGGIYYIIGPEFGFDFYKVNPGTGKLKTFSLFGFIMPLPGAFTISAGVAKSF